MRKISFYFAAYLLLVLFWTPCYLDPKKRMMWNIIVKLKSY